MLCSRATATRIAGAIAALLGSTSFFRLAECSSSLLPLVFDPLPLGSISAEGWLHDQLQLMADGLAGHEHDFYLYVSNSSWLGGTYEYSDLNEGFPYWFNGLVPLAYGLDDERLKTQVLDSVDYVISHQQADGWLGPETEVSERNIWGRFPLFLGLCQLAEVTNGTDVATRVLDSMHSFVNLLYSMLEDNWLGYVSQTDAPIDDQWPRARAADMMLSLQWMYENDPRNDSDVLFGCMELLYEKASNWSDWYVDGTYIFGDLDDVPLNITNYYYPFEHGVNIGQGYKFGAVVRRFTGDDSAADTSRTAVNWTLTYHGQPSGVMIADERLSGLSPVRGVELCAVVESLYSLNYLYQSLGDSGFADNAEQVAYNALPVMLVPDWWAHQYVSETNQPISHTLTEPPFYNVDDVGQHYGLEPNYPCCTVNHPQGYPKYVSNSYVQVGDNGIAHALLGPTSVNTTTKSGVSVSVSVDTLYPFVYELTYTVEASDAFDFYIRVPNWATAASFISINSGPYNSLEADADSALHQISIEKGRTTIFYSLAGDIRVADRANDTVSIYHGPILYTLAPGEKYSPFSPNYPDAPAQAQLFNITPTSPWALAIDTSTLKYNAASDDASLPNPIWSLNAPPVSMSATVCEISWNLTYGYAPNPPLKGDRQCIGDSFEATLVPYGSAKLHIAEIPTMDSS